MATLPLVLVVVVLTVFATFPVPDLSLDPSARLHQDFLSILAQFYTQVRVLVTYRVVLVTENKQHPVSNNSLLFMIVNMYKVKDLTWP